MFYYLVSLQESAPNISQTIPWTNYKTNRHIFTSSTHSFRVHDQFDVVFTKLPLVQ